NDENIININKVTAFDKELEKAKTELSALKDEEEKLNRSYESQKKVKDNYSEDIAKLEKDILYKNHEIEKLKNKIEFQLNLLENYGDYSEGIKHLIKDKNEKDAQVVIDNLEVDDKFKIAIETALGEISNYLIVNDLASAEKCIKVVQDD